jgi:cold shock CspA family protein
VATGTITWIDSGRDCCFITPDIPGRDLYVDRTEVDSGSTPLHVGAKVEYATRPGRRGKCVVTNVAAEPPANRAPEPPPTSAEAATDVWEWEGGAVR